MPSAKIETKLETKPSTEVNDCSPLRQILVAIEHKIRNLEKRKVRLDSYKDLQKSGKDLTVDQLAAVAKYDEVIQILEFAREFVKHIQTISANSEKEQRKNARRELAQKTQQDISKIREVFVIQNTLENLNIDTIRTDFANGTNGAVKLEENDFEVLEKFANDSKPPKRPDFPDESSYTTQSFKAAEHMLYLIDGRPKPYHGEVTYEKLKTIILSVNASGYFNKSDETTVTENNNGEATESPAIPVSSESETREETPIAEVMNQDPDSEIMMENVESNDEEIEMAEAPAPSAVPAPVFPSPILTNSSSTVISNLPNQPVPIPAMIPTPVPGVVPPVAVAVSPSQISHIGATTVRAVEQAYYKQHQYIQQIQPIAEVLSSGSFFFLQDSELDSPDPFPNVGGFQSVQPQIIGIQHSPTGPVPQSQPPPQQNIQQQSMPPPAKSQQQPSNIPTQTFTNQTFKPIVSQSGPAVYPQMKPVDISSAHIPGFVTSNPSIPVAIAPAGTILTPPLQNPVHIIAPASGAVPIPGFVSPQYAQNIVPAPQAVSLQHQQPQHVQQQQSQLPAHANQENSNLTVPIPQQQQQQQQQLTETTGNQNEKLNQGRLSPIENWAATDAPPNDNDSCEWRDPSSMGGGGDSRESKEWNNDNQNESNTWNDPNQEHSYNNRGYRSGPRNSSGPRNTRPLSDRSSGGGNGGGGDRGHTGYRGRPNNSYQSSNSGGGGRVSGGNNANTFFRNNDNNYYQMQNGGASGAGSGTSGSATTGSGNYNAGYSNGTYKPRGAVGNNVRSGNSSGHLRNNSGGQDNRINQPRSTNNGNLSSRNGGAVQGGPPPSHGGNMRSSRGGGGGGGTGSTSGTGGGTGNFNNSRNGNSSQLQSRNGQCVK